MPPRRYRCRRCRNRIDIDHRTCPFCGAEDPLRHRRAWRHRGMVAIAFTVLVLSAWIVLL